MVEPTTRRVVDVPDRVLVAAAQDGDREAFGVLVERHQAAMYRLAFRLLGSRSDAEDAEDAGQEGFVQAWRSIDRFRAESTFSTWLHRIVTNKCLDVIASRRTVDELPEAWTAAAAATGAGGDAATVAEGRARFRTVADAIARFPTDQRAALVLRDLQGLGYAEVADVLDVPLSTIRTRIHRARLAVVQDVGEL